MANHKSALKRIRTNEKKRVLNIAIFLEVALIFWKLVKVNVPNVEKKPKFRKMHDYKKDENYLRNPKKIMMILEYVLIVENLLINF